MARITKKNYNQIISGIAHPTIILYLIVALPTNIKPFL
jgi:hypothetical protein